MIFIDMIRGQISCEQFKKADRSVHKLDYQSTKVESKICIYNAEIGREREREKKSFQII